MDGLCPEVGIQEMLVLSFDGCDDGNMREHIIAVVKQRNVNAEGRKAGDVGTRTPHPACGVNVQQTKTNRRP